MPTRARHQFQSLPAAVLVLVVALLQLTVAAPAFAAPATPSGVRATSVGARTVKLAWRASPGAAKYAVYRNGTRVGLTTRTSFADSGLAFAHNYGYRIQARGGGRVSGKSVTVPTTTRHGGSCTHYATPDGNNASSGTSADHPVRTLARLASLLGSGDVGCLRGSFVEDLTINSGGTAAAPVVLRNRPGYTATVRGRMVVSDSANHVVLQGLRIDGHNVNGDDLPSPTINGDDVRVLRNDISNGNHHICVILGSVNGYGQARNVILDGNRIHNCGARPGNNHHHGVYVENSVGARITNNVIFDNADRGIQLYPNAQKTFVARNVIDGNGEGVIFSGADGYSSSNNSVIDNVITNARTRYNIEHWWQPGNPVGTGNSASRNCLYGGHDGEMSLPAVGWISRANVTANPRYRNRAAHDYRPASGSGCRYLLSGAQPLRAV